MSTYIPTTSELFKFLQSPNFNDYANGGKYEAQSERKGFYEISHTDGRWHYLDSYTGHYRSWGSELVRYDGVPFWCTQYGGGMVDGEDSYAEVTFEFLKTALGQPTNHFSARGPSKLTLDKWSYEYKQSGDITAFHGYERIFLKNKLVFWHRIIGGIIRHKS